MVLSDNNKIGTSGSEDSKKGGAQCIGRKEMDANSFLHFGGTIPLVQLSLLGTG
jgi:hypothetical protein